MTEVELSELESQLHSLLVWQPAVGSLMSLSLSFLLFNMTVMTGLLRKAAVIMKQDTVCKCLARCQAYCVSMSLAVKWE